MSLWMDKDRSLWEDTRGGASLFYIAKGGGQRRKVDVRKEFKKGAKKKEKEKESMYTTKVWVGTLRVVIVSSLDSNYATYPFVLEEDHPRFVIHLGFSV